MVEDPRRSTNEERTRRTNHNAGAPLTLCPPFLCFLLVLCFFLPLFDDEPRTARLHLADQGHGTGHVPVPVAKRLSWCAPAVRAASITQRAQRQGRHRFSASAPRHCFSIVLSIICEMRRLLRHSAAGPRRAAVPPRRPCTVVAVVAPGARRPVPVPALGACSRPAVPAVCARNVAR